ncbi:hypothetical protein JVV93_20715, partial [Vibrio cholerae O1]
VFLNLVWKLNRQTEVEERKNRRNPKANKRPHTPFFRYKLIAQNVVGQTCEYVCSFTELLES